MSISTHGACKDTQSCLLSPYCGKGKGDTTSRSLTIWIVALDLQTVQMFVHQPGRPIEPLNMGCCCSSHAGNLDNLAKYLDAALACGKYDGLVLIGAEDALKAIKKRLSAAVHNRVIAEIFDDITGKAPHEVAQRIAERITGR